MQDTHYRLAVDVGGTFTDLVIFDEASGRIQTLNVSCTPRSIRRRRRQLKFVHDTRGRRREKNPEQIQRAHQRRRAPEHQDPGRRRFGEKRERDIQTLKRDFVDGKISAAKIEADYGAEILQSVTAAR